MRFPKYEIDDTVIEAISLAYHIEELSLFGSILTERFTEESDIDLLVVFNEGVAYSLFDLFAIQEVFEKALGRRVDLVEKGSLRNPYRKELILKNAKVIYAA